MPPTPAVRGTIHLSIQHMTLTSSRGVLSLMAAVAIVPIAQAQERAPTDTTQAQQTLFNKRDAWLAAGFAGLTVLMFPIDKHIETHLRDQSTPANRFFDRSATGLEFISTPGSFIIGGALYGVGVVADKPKLKDLGWHGTEAVILASGITGVLKGVLGRARPDAFVDTRPSDFKLGKGFTTADRQSFPSGHSTTAFAAAAAVTSEVNRMWPKYTWYVGPVLYSGATLVGLSRMFHNRHWASDVALGAGIGTFSGLKVVKYTHAHPDNLFDRIMLRTSAAPDGRGGAYIVWSAPPF
jgi:membrane-associated phospholipid phosphatase